MIAKQIVGSNFRGVLNYNEKKIKEYKGELIGTNMLGTDSKTLSKEFDLISALKPNVSKAVYHTSLSIAQDEQLSNDQFQELGEKYLNKMGFGNSQYLIYRHTDQEHPHIHLLANRIDMNGDVVSDKWNYKKSEKVVRQLEKEYGLKEVISSDKVEDKALSKGQIENYRRTGQIPVRTQLQIITKEVLAYACSLSDFESKMNQAGANVLFHKNKQGKIFGASFELDGVKFKASQLGKAYSWNKIKNQLNYEQDQRIGPEEGGGKNTNIGSTNRTLAEYEQEKHSRANRGNISNNTQYQGVGNSNQGGIKGGSRSTSDLPENSSFSRAKDESVGEHSTKDEKINSLHEGENISGIDTGREPDRNSHISIPLPIHGNRIDSDEEEEEEEIKRRKASKDFDQSF